jgi:hypothetical protein
MFCALQRDAMAFLLQLQKKFKWRERRGVEWADWFSFWLALKAEYWTQTAAWSWRTDIARVSHSGGRGWDLLNPADGNNHHPKVKWVQTQSYKKPVCIAWLVSVGGTDVLLFSGQKERRIEVSTKESLRISRKHFVHSLFCWIVSNSSVR